jgi:hypothetical protein
LCFWCVFSFAFCIFGDIVHHNTASHLILIIIISWIEGVQVKLGIDNPSYTVSTLKQKQIMRSVQLLRGGVSGSHINSIRRLCRVK